MGIGRALAKELTGRGLTTIAIARSTELLNSLARETGEGLIAVVADLASDEGREQASKAVAPFRQVEGIVHAAGSLIPLEPYREMNPTDLTQHFDIHVSAPIALMQRIAASKPILRSLFIDSYSASEPRAGWSAYSIIKSAAQMSARAAAQELTDTKVIRAFPGAVSTRIVDEVLKSDTPTCQTFAAMVEAGKCATATDAAKFLTAILVDVPDDDLGSRDVWDYHAPDVRRQIERHAPS